MTLGGRLKGPRVESPLARMLLSTCRTPPPSRGGSLSPNYNPYKILQSHNSPGEVHFWPDAPSPELEIARCEGEMCCGAGTRGLCLPGVLQQGLQQ